jgi:hypothetical protein
MTRTFDFQSTYKWGDKTIKLVPLFAMDQYIAQDDELLWVYDTTEPDSSYHVPVRMIH